MKFKDISWDGALLAVCGFIALVLSILDFLPLLQLTNDVALRVALSCIGLLLMAAVVQTAQGRHHFDELQQKTADLKNTIGATDIKFFNWNDELHQHTAWSARNAKLINDTFLNWDQPADRPKYLSGDYRRLIFERVREGEIERFQDVHVIYHKSGLEEVIYRLLLYEGSAYYIKYYDPSPKTIPMIHITSFDNKSFYVSTGYPKELPSNHPVLYIDGPNINRMLNDYWNTLWGNAVPLNPGGAIDWRELEKIGRRLGFSDADFEKTRSTIEEEVERDKKQLKKR